MPRRLLAILLAVATTALVLAPGRVADSSAGAPGAVLRAAPRPGGGFTLEYRSTSAGGAPAIHRAVLWLPEEPSGHVVAWGHRTAGLADRCAPSAQDHVEVPGLGALLDAGHVVVAPDYPGLGTPGEHPYLVGDEAGRDLLDAVRAAQRVSGARGGVAVYGWSQGGHAALFAGRLAREHAPELDLRGVAGVGSVLSPLDLLAPGAPFAGHPGFVALVAAGYESVYDELDAATLLPAPGGLGVARRTCALEAAAALADVPVAPPDERWRARLAQNDASAALIPVPVLLAHGDHDGLLPVADVVGAYGRLCRAGGAVRLLRQPVGGHGHLAPGTVDAVVDWLDERLRGEPLTGCAHRRLSAAS